MSRFCRIFIAILAGAYVLALAGFAIGTLGLFGQEPDPLSGILLIPLGLPWNQWIGLFPEAAWPWLAAIAPALNILLAAAVCRIASRHARITRR